MLDEDLEHFPALAVQGLGYAGRDGDGVLPVGLQPQLDLVLLKLAPRGGDAPDRREAGGSWVFGLLTCD